jgi:peptidoglycan-associated lipoprotein
MNPTNVATIFVACIACACSPSRPAPKTAPTGTFAPTPGMTPASRRAPVQAEMRAKKQTDVPTQSQISLSDEIKKACQISDPDAYFMFDSAKLNSRDERVAKQLADCFTTGPMKGKSMRLVGHADPRGDEEYNMVLGEHRANNVKQFLTQRGIGADRVQTTSRGKMDAEGHDEVTWAHDRRVDVLAE